jgi:hypothetical protein
LQEALQQEQQKTAALTEEAKAAQAVSTAAGSERLAAVSTIADLQSPQQENQQAQVASEVPRKLNALAKFSRQQSGKAASNQTIEDVKAELKPSVRQDRFLHPTPARRSHTPLASYGEPHRPSSRD